HGGEKRTGPLLTAKRGGDRVSACRAAAVSRPVGFAQKRCLELYRLCSAVGRATIRKFQTPFLGKARPEGWVFHVLNRGSGAPENKWPCPFFVLRMSRTRIRDPPRSPLLFPPSPPGRGAGGEGGRRVSSAGSPTNGPVPFYSFISRA